MGQTAWAPQLSPGTPQTSTGDIFLKAFYCIFKKIPFSCKASGLMTIQGSLLHSRGSALRSLSRTCHSSGKRPNPPLELMGVWAPHSAPRQAGGAGRRERTPAGPGAQAAEPAAAWQDTGPGRR